MPKQADSRASKPNPLYRARAFLQGVKDEMKKVAWPSREELKSSTSIVLLLLGLMAAIIGIYDIVFQFVMLKFLALG